jgi:Tfp pilus assembly protein FimT
MPLSQPDLPDPPMHHTSPTLHRKAITLIEVLLVLALLAMLAAMTWPALDRPMANQRLRKAADKVRTTWVKARVNAMSTGQTLVFRCTLESDEYTMEAQAGPESVDSMTSSNEGQFDDTGNSATTQTEPLSSKTHRLLEDIRFVDGEVTFDTRATILGDSTLGDSTLDTSTDSSSLGVDPILFFPDGTTSTAKLVLENQHQRRVELSLRGLTGVITVGDTYPAEDSIHAP